MKLLIIIFLLNIFLVRKYRNYVESSSLAGDFRVEMKHAGSCEEGKAGKNLIQYNLKAVRNAKGKKELVGNITYLIPFDDTIAGTFYLEKYSPDTGRYTPNYFRLKLQHVCTDTGRYLATAWKNFQKSINMPTTCPVPKGVYHVKGYDINLLFDKKITALPATFFFGKYKLYLIFEKNNETIGCHYENVECVPVWPAQNPN